ncbi:MAG TPA: choice-of-anchor tandem repeat GloVer-containing protein [Verrucomicrobiae bacterium]
MTQTKSRLTLPAIAGAFIISCIAAFLFGPVYGQEILHAFPGVQEPDGALVQGTNGNFYGTTYWGGSAGHGSVFEMTPAGSVTTLVSFTATNGGHPYAALTLGNNGNFYGTTFYGGNLALNNGGGLGTVFEMTPAGMLTTLVQFDATNGGFPHAGLTLGSDGNFYGTTFYGGNLALNGGGGDGTVFQMTPEGVLTTLVEFNGATGANPGAPLAQGSDGNFYGTTHAGGVHNLGTVFQMAPDGSLNRLVSFNSSNGDSPTAGLVEGIDGNFYGTTYSGGLNGLGTVFQMTPDGVLRTLVSFNATNGGNPYSALVRGTDGNLYGTTQRGGNLSLNSGNGYGTVFKVTTNGTLSTLISFTGINGANPLATLMIGADGKFYGATSEGGIGGGGVLFRLDISAPLSLAQQPDDLSLSFDSKAVFQASAVGAAPLAYQWSFNGAALLNATKATLTISNIQSTNAGLYVVIVTNKSGSVTSRVATLQVDSTFTRVMTGAIVTQVGAGTACAWGDYDGDGFPDLIVTSANNVANSTPQKNLLYHNNRDGTFSLTNTAISVDLADWRGCSWVDYDNDGNLDLVVTSTDANGFPAENAIFHNNGNGTFTKMSKQTAGDVVTATAGESEGPVWADYDRDGFVDLYVARYDEDWLFHNNGDGFFKQIVNTNIGIVQDDRDSYNAMWSDYDNDGWPDLFVSVKSANDNNQTNFLYHNQQNASFMRFLQGPVATDNQYSIGCVWADYDNDGYPDLFVANGLNNPGVNSLYHNNGDGTFAKMTSEMVGSIASDVGYFTQCVWGDYDNDGYLDLFVTADGQYSVNNLYHNNGDGTFTRMFAGSTTSDAGISFGCGWADYDNDGFLDLFVARGSDSFSSVNLLYRNNGNSNTWLKVKLVGTVSNRSAIGAKVRVHATIGGKTFWQLREINTGDGFSANSMEAHFGLGNATNVDALRIEWPSGTVQEFQNVAAKQYLTITEPPRLSATMTNGVPQFFLKGGRGFQYDIQASTDLAAWSSVSTTTITNLSGIAQIIDTNAGGSIQRFYRAVSHH